MKKTYFFCIILLIFCFAIPQSICFAIPQLDIDKEQLYSLDEDIFNKDTRWDETLEDFLYAHHCAKDRGVLTESEAKEIIKNFSSYVVKEYLSSEKEQYASLPTEKRFTFIINVAQALIHKATSCKNIIEQTYKEENGSQCAKKLQNIIYLLDEKEYNTSILKEALLLY